MQAVTYPVVAVLELVAADAHLSEFIFEIKFAGFGHKGVVPVQTFIGFEVVV